MKNYFAFFLFALLISGQAVAQDTKIFSLSPMSIELDQVNGLVVGIGHFQENLQLQRINGVNIELTILSPFFVLHGLNGHAQAIDQGWAWDSVSVVDMEPDRLVSNGLNLGVGGYFDRVSHHGLSIAMFHSGNRINGVSVHAGFSMAFYANGLHISGIQNAIYKMNGVGISLINSSQTFNGIQLGLFNRSDHMRGWQIGLRNRSKRLRGVQIGLWNTNGRRSLPIINF